MNQLLEPRVVLGGVLLLYVGIWLFAFWSSKMQKKGGINRLLPTVVVGKAGVVLFVAAPIMVLADMPLRMLDIYPAQYINLINSIFFTTVPTCFFGGFFLIIAAQAMAA